MTDQSFEMFDKEEMRRFGFDPASDADRKEWASTTPPEGTPAIYDYSRDAFEYGSEVTRQQGSDTVE